LGRKEKKEEEKKEGRNQTENYKKKIMKHENEEKRKKEKRKEKQSGRNTNENRNQRKQCQRNRRPCESRHQSSRRQQPTSYENQRVCAPHQGAEALREGRSKVSCNFKRLKKAKDAKLERARRSCILGVREATGRNSSIKGCPCRKQELTSRELAWPKVGWERRVHKKFKTKMKARYRALTHL